MDSENLNYFVDYVGTSGCVLNPEQKSALESSLVLLKFNNKFHKVYFWGKILGVKSDYFIAQGVPRDELLSVRTFYSFDCLNWAQLPAVNKEMEAKCKKAKGRFIGDPSHEYEILEKKPTEDEEQVEEEEPIQFKEEERLAVCIDTIDANVRIVPRRSFIQTPKLKVEENRTFEGLDVLESAKLESYFHFRKPVSLPKKSLLEKADLEKSIDFLDDISEDIPKGSWSLQFERGSGLVIIRNLMWPGYTFFHVPGTRKFGSVYNGSGEKNIDLPFMI